MIWSRLALALLVTTCAVAPPAPRPPVTTRDVAVWIDADFTPEDALEIRNAVAQWNYALNGYVRLGDFGEHVVHIYAERDSADVGGPDLLGWDSRTGGREIHLVPGRIHGHGRSVGSIALHELGHYLGLEHDPGPGALMSSPVDRAVECIDTRTVRRLAQVNGWEARHMNATCS